MAMTSLLRSSVHPASLFAPLHPASLSAPLELSPGLSNSRPLLVRTHSSSFFYSSIKKREPLIWGFNRSSRQDKRRPVSKNPCRALRQEHNGSADDKGRAQQPRVKVQVLDRTNKTSVFPWCLKRLADGALFLGLPVVVSGVNLEGLGSVLQALAVLATIITIHEAGHFFAARLQNIHVTKFAIGFGPTLFSTSAGGVEYSIRAIPLGGFVAFPDDDPESSIPPEDPNLLKNRPIKDRALVISAGVIANVLFAFAILFTQVQTVGIVQQEFLPGITATDVLIDSAALRAGVQKGDVIFTIDGAPLPGDPSAVQTLVSRIQRSAEVPIVLGVKRGSEAIDIPVLPDRAIDGSGRVGLQLSANSAVTHVVERNVVRAFLAATQQMQELTGTVLEGLRQIVFNFASTADRVSGPVAIVAVGAEVARSDFAGLFQFAAVVNLNLAVVNILPLPALDGGYLALLFVERVRGGKKLPEGWEQGIMSSGLLLLLTVGMVLIVRDTLNLSFVQNLLG